VRYSLSMNDIRERVYHETCHTHLPCGKLKVSTIIEENCECMINPGHEGPEGGEFLHPFLEEPDPDCPDCGGHGRFLFVEEKFISVEESSVDPF